MLGNVGHAGKVLRHDLCVKSLSAGNSTRSHLAWEARQAFTCDDYYRCVANKNLVDSSILLSPIIQSQVRVKWDIELHLTKNDVKGGYVSQKQHANSMPNTADLLELAA